MGPKLLHRPIPARPTIVSIASSDDPPTPISVTIGGDFDMPAPRGPSIKINHVRRNPAELSPSLPLPILSGRYFNKGAARACYRVRIALHF